MAILLLLHLLGIQECCCTTHPPPIYQVMGWPCCRLPPWNLQWCFLCLEECTGNSKPACTHRRVTMSGNTRGAAKRPRQPSELLRRLARCAHLAYARPWEKGAPTGGTAQAAAGSSVHKCQFSSASTALIQAMINTWRAISELVDLGLCLGW